ncbi:MAG: phosphomannomutase/phosphoglucomutase [Armatimonadota bacterium]|nr:phosphomannomutase/phosphoglucomutase [Armatimonadota bacterium]
MRLVTTIPGHIFREYDIRGVVGEDLTPEGMYTIARAFATFLVARGAERRALVGRDNRLHSPALAGAAVEGLRDGGFAVVDIGTVITPAFYFARIHYGIDGGMMITASHNPPEYNGVKLAHGHATLYGEEIQAVRRLVEGGDFVSGRGRVEERDVLPAYKAMLAEKIRLGRRRLKVAVDCGNGTASLVAPDVIESWGVEVLRQHCDSDPTFPHHQPNPVKPENVQDLIELVRRERCDLGIGFDGDGDRIGVVDDQGQIVWGDILMILFWREILPRHPGALALIEVKCSQALVDEVERLGGRPLFHPTGHSLIKATMRQRGAVFAGEMSGHMFFADEYFGYDDAVYAAGRLLRILSGSQEALSTILSTLPRYPATPEVYLEVSDALKFDVVRRVTKEFQAQGYPVVDVDGARILFPDGWGLVRASNTQPALVLRAEARNAPALGRVKRLLEETLARVAALPHPEW